jgi:hypothetical protein
MKIFCKKCGIALSNEIKELKDKNLVDGRYNEPLFPEGYFCSNQETLNEFFTEPNDLLVINRNDLINAIDHTDLSRVQGCCGLHGMDGPNKMCINGHEIATELSDCWTLKYVRFLTDAVVLNL